MSGRKRGPTALQRQLPEVRCDSCFDYSRGGSVDGTVRPAARIWVRLRMPASRTNEWTRRWQQLRGDRTTTIMALPKEQRVVADVLVSGGADLSGPIPLVSGGADLAGPIPLEETRSVVVTDESEGKSKLCAIAQTGTVLQGVLADLSAQ